MSIRLNLSTGFRGGQIETESSRVYEGQKKGSGKPEPSLAPYRLAARLLQSLDLAAGRQVTTIDVGDVSASDCQCGRNTCCTANPGDVASSINGRANRQEFTGDFGVGLVSVFNIH